MKWLRCRLPGGIRSPSDLWDLLAAKKTTQGRVPAGRFNIAGYYHPDGKRAGVMDADGGYFLDEDVRQFDNSVFGINNLEATYMDPQQRKLLEVTYECLESAGLSMEDVSGTDTAVYIGNFTVDYQTMQTRDPDYLHRSQPHYLYRAASRNYEGRVLSPTSTCHTFDASADGYGRGEAVNAVLIKPLSRAIRDGDNIRAIIRGTAMLTRGLNSQCQRPDQRHTQPSARFQEAVIRKAYANAGLNMADTDTLNVMEPAPPLGIPSKLRHRSVFLAALWSPLMIGACNLTNATYRSSMNYRNGHGELRRASINSFGYGGANAHVILEDPKSFLKDNSHIESFGELTQRLKSETVSSLMTLSVSNFCQIQMVVGEAHRAAFTLGEHRAHLSHRAFIIANHGRAEDAVWRLAKTLMRYHWHLYSQDRGAQYPAWAKELLKREVVFRDSIKELDAVLQAIPWRDQRPSWTLEQTILDPPETSMIHDVTRSQPVCTAIQIALVDLLDSWGFKQTGHLSAAQAIQVAYFRGAAVGKLENRGAMLAAGLTPDAAHELIQELDLAGRVCVACVNAPESITLSGEFAAIDLVKKTLEKRGAFSRALADRWESLSLAHDDGGGRAVPGDARDHVQLPAA
ncbi:unnamed protein product, partial [Clonostachys rosea f. rosea IK726]